MDITHKFIGFNPETMCLWQTYNSYRAKYMKSADIK